MAESRTGPKFGHPPPNCKICSSFIVIIIIIIIIIISIALLIEPHNCAWAIHRNPVNGLMLILGFYG